MLARTRRVLLLAAALFAGLELRAAAQSGPPAVPADADPAAILLAPIHPGATSDIPLSPRPSAEPAAKLNKIGDAEIVRVSEFHESRKLPSDLPERKKYSESTGDAFDYLTEGIRKPKKRSTDDDSSRRKSEQLGDRIEDILGGKGGGFFDRDRKWFNSDCEFDNFVSPVTNPFLFEDPRSLTEIRPIFIYQRIPGGAGLFQGGNAWFVGTQGRLAITDRFSLVVNKFGLTGFNPASGSTVEDSFGFAEIHLGPKFVVYRDTETKTLITLGGTFQIPTGSSKAFQDTGKLSIVPYVSAARRLWDTRIGTFNGLASSGYSFSTDGARSDYFYLSGHLDLDVANNGRFFPLIEMNWIQYTKNGNSTNLGVEGRDLANFGSQRAGTGMVTIAAGARFKINSNWEVGGAFELPLVGSRDIFQYRMMFDLIWRY